MKKIIGIALIAAFSIGCEKEVDLPLNNPFGTCCGLEKTEEVTFRDYGTCSGMWFERKCGDLLEVYNYHSTYPGFCGTQGLLQPGDKVQMTYQCYDDSELIQCEALCAFEAENRRKGIPIKTVERIQD